MTDPREALERLTRWRKTGGAAISPAMTKADQFAADVVALLSTVEQLTSSKSIKPVDFQE
ncbi:hypothetical protein TSA6c_00090 [Azospirillum sp. TSA6c]|uniref:hypothetical protein n=1 Tax=Azospirillum sp. TSA6c TaxID=709813 RepID=UPI000D61739F|nr:hypothetical protein [Azospirillum sp. TSA6c]PWC54680.1 hypothetical protein TSA6c_00090 [Azospirillum sp. TSA6c]